MTITGLLAGRSSRRGVSAAAALALYRQHRGDRPVTGMIYTHSHGDHFGGVRGVVTGEVPILAPGGFLEHAVEENVYAGAARARSAPGSA